MRTPEHRRVLIEIAWPEDGEAISKLARECGFELEGMDWSRLGSHWLVCKWRGEIVGAIQILLGLPIGRLEILSIASQLGVVQRSLVIRELVIAGLAAHRQYGAQSVAGTMSEQFTKILERRNGVVVDRGNVVAWRI